jgi:hypothetical protein
MTFYFAVSEVDVKVLAHTVPYLALRFVDH